MYVFRDKTVLWGKSVRNFYIHNGQVVPGNLHIQKIFSKFTIYVRYTSDSLCNSLLLNLKTL